MHARSPGERRYDSAQALAELDRVAADPAALQYTPASVVADANLSREQKLRFLRSWARDLREGSGTSPDPVLLRLVNSAISDVERAATTRGWAPRSAWPRR